MTKPRRSWMFVALVVAACGGPSTSTSEPPAGVDPATPPDVTVPETPIDFGLADCGGAAPDARLVKISNAGGGAVSWTAELEAAGFEIVGATSGTFTGGGSVNVAVRAKPVPASATAAAVSAATLVVVIDKAKIFRVPLRVTAHGAMLTVTPADVPFGELPINVQGPDLPLVIKNTGNKDLSVSLAQPALTDFKIDWTGSPAAVTVPAGATMPGAVARFRPSKLAVQTTSSAIAVTGTVCGATPTAITLSGHGSGGVVGISPGQLDYGTVSCGATGGVQVFTILNSGNSPFTWSAAIAAGSASKFDVAPLTGMVAPNGQTTVTVTPKAIPSTSAVTPNLYGDTITITTNAANDTPHPIVLKMGAKGAILARTATPADYGVKGLFGTATLKTATITNSGNTSASVKLAVGTASYSVNPSASTPIAAGGALNVDVGFSPTSFGANNDQLSMTTSDVLCAPLPAPAALTGQGKGVASYVSVGAGIGVRKGATTPPYRSSACAVLTGGHVACWGENSFGQLGTGASSSVPQTTPVIIPSFSGVVAVASAGDFACARTTAGTVYCWGNNAEGQLGAAGGSKSSPALVSGVTNVISLAAGTRHACAVTAAAAGGTTGKVMCWGMNDRNQLGTAVTPPPNPSPPIAVANITDASSVSVGSFGGCARRTNNAVSCWGQSNNKGMLGNGGVADNTAGTPVSVVNLTNATVLESGGSYRGRSGDSCAISGGNVLCWGDNNSGRLVSGGPVDLSTPTTVVGVTGATALAMGKQHECAIVTNGAVKCWGKGAAGQLGNGATPGSSVPVDVTGLTGATQISSGGESTCAVLTSGAVTCWGSNSNGQLGNPAAAKITPTVVSGF
jgi:alpha-tubulin suppressor-like RCC1 family protein